MVTETPSPELDVKRTTERQHVIDQRIHQRIAECPYAFYLNRVAWRYEDGLLTLEGCVPTFYLKKMIQSILRDVEHVEQLDNRVNVVSSTGLSSVPRK